MKVLVLCLLSLVARNAAAHDLQDNRALLVLRERNHVSVTLFLAYSDVLHRALAPVRPMAEFLAAYSAMKPEDLQKQLQRAQTGFETATKIYLPAGGEIPISHWIWPDAKKVQDLLRHITMQAVLDPNGHFHEEPTEIYADAIAQQELVGIRVRFPQEFQKVLVVSYRPSQLWVEADSLSPAIRF